MYTGWQLSKNEKQKLLERFPPKYDRVVAHHITHDLGNKPLPPKAGEAFVVGHIARDGVEALVVMINRTTHRYTLGGYYHITWSLDKGRKPVDSNVVLRRYGYNFVKPIELKELRERQF